MNQRISRRGFLKLGALALGTLAFNPVFPYENDQGYGMLGRIAIKEIDMHSMPNETSRIIGKRYRDQLVNIYQEITSPDGPAYNPLWYQVWGGYLHSAHIQRVFVHFNKPLDYVPESGQLSEVTVPYTTAYEKTANGWNPWPSAPLYYGTTHWATGVAAGPDGQPWYQITSELTDGLIYYVPARHLRTIPDAEISPLSPEVPAAKKRLEVNIARQTVTAYEFDKVVFTTRVSTGIHRPKPVNGIPTDTPKGQFNIFSKMPNKHMGSVTGNPDDSDPDHFSLPGVPWTSFFVDTGVSFHGTFWHNNFGIEMSHGCVNMRTEDAKWLFRWTTPLFVTPIKTHADWEQKGMGTRVDVI